MSNSHRGIVGEMPSISSGQSWIITCLCQEIIWTGHSDKGARGKGHKRLPCLPTHKAKAFQTTAQAGRQAIRAMLEVSHNERSLVTQQTEEHKTLGEHCCARAGESTKISLNKNKTKETKPRTTNALIPRQSS